MTHTVEGYVTLFLHNHTIQCSYGSIRNSGVGDFGKAGIKTFLEQHSCNELCVALGLDKSMPLVFDESEDMDESDDDN
jgi:hypothetical protein